MSEEHLIPLGQKGNEEHDKAVRAKLKGSASDKRKIAQRIAGIKKAKPENVEKKLLALITDPKTSALEIMIMIEEVKNHDMLRPDTKIQLINAAIKAHSTIFGTKSFSVNMNLNPKSHKSMNELYLEIISERNNELYNEKQSNTSDDREGDTEGSDKE